ncbi:MAG: hypothetical protein C0465_17855 [Ralstonia sp.]|nr:hypothetical protein [Ralstonia sp.]
MRDEVMSVIWRHHSAWKIKQRLSLWRRERAAKTIVARAFQEWRDAAHVDGDCFDAANVERFDAWLMVAYPDALAEIPEHERRDFTAGCVRHRAIKEGRYRSPRAGRRLPRRKAEVRESGEAGDGSGEA